MCKASTTLTALIRLLTRMGKRVFFQIASFRKAFVALPAFVGFFTPVEALMNCQRMFMSKILIALLTFIRFLTRVDP